MGNEEKKKEWGKWCGFKNIDCRGSKTDCALKDPNTGTCVFIAINNNLYHIREALEKLPEMIDERVKQAIDESRGPGLV